MFWQWIKPLSKTNSMTKKERKIYNAILKAFPATSKQAAKEYALQGGVKFQFICKI